MCFFFTFTGVLISKSKIWYVGILPRYSCPIHPTMESEDRAEGDYGEDVARQNDQKWCRTQEVWEINCYLGGKTSKKHLKKIEQKCVFICFFDIEDDFLRVTVDYRHCTELCWKHIASRSHFAGDSIVLQSAATCSNKLSEMESREVSTSFPRVPRWFFDILCAVLFLCTVFHEVKDIWQCRWSLESDSLFSGCFC